MTQETKAGEPRLVSYCPEMQTCTLNLNGEEYYYNLTATAGKETKADEPVVWLFNGADGLWLNITCAGKHYSLNLSSDKMSHPVAVAIVNKFCNGKIGTGRIHVTDQETKADEPVGEVTHTDVLPDSNGMYRHEFLSSSRIPNQAELYLISPDTKALRQRVKEQSDVIVGMGERISELENLLIEAAHKEIDQAEQIKVTREAIVTLRKFVGDPANFDCYGTEEELSDFLQRVKRDEDAAIKQADEALAKLGEQ